MTAAFPRSRTTFAAVAAAAAAVAVLASAEPARAERPSNERLVLVGLGLAVPVYFLDVVIHEGSHAALASALGAEVVELRMLPTRYDGRWYFGLTRWQGTLERHELAWVLAAPAVVQGALLTTYSLLVGLGGLPSNAYGQLALVVLATGSWVDFSKDVIGFGAGNDFIRLHALYGRTTERQRLPYRFLHAALSAAAGFFVVKGYIQLFSPATANTAAAAPAVALPLFATSF